MTRPPRFVHALTLAVAALGLPAAWVAGQAAPAAPADPAAPAAPATPGTPVPADPGAGAPAAEDPTKDPVYLASDKFLHFLRVGDFAQAATAAGELTAVVPEATPDAKAAVRAIGLVEKAFTDRGLEFDPTLYIFRENAPLKEPIDALLKKFDTVRTAVVREPEVINQNIGKLSTGNLRERNNALAGLVRAGEIAVPAMVAKLKDATARDLHPSVQLALGQMRGSAVVPLIAVTESKDDELVDKAMTVLVGLQAQEATPWLVRVAEDTTRPALASRAVRLLANQGVNVKSAKSADLFYQLAERFYYNAAGLRPDPRDAGKARVWFYDDANGGRLYPVDVPADIYADVQSMRYAEQAIKGGTGGDAVSLWLAANNKREAQLQAGQEPGLYKDPSAHFWNVKIGSQHVNQVLLRAMRDGSGRGLMTPAQRPVHTQVAMRAIKSLAEIVGQNSLNGSPLVEAMRYPDKVVRYEAALALAGGLPQKPFQGQDRVVLLLAECLAQNPTPGVLIMAPSADDVRRLGEGLGADIKSAGGTNAAEVIVQSARLPSIDVILIAPGVNDEEVRRFLMTANESPRFDHAARVVVVKEQNSPWYQTAMADGRVTVVTSEVLPMPGAKPAAPAAPGGGAPATQPAAPADPAAPAAAPATQPTDPAMAGGGSAGGGNRLLEAVVAARKKAGGIQLSDAEAAEYAGRSADVLYKLTISRGQVLNVGVAEPTLLAALSDNRALPPNTPANQTAAEVKLASKAARVVGLLDSPQAQQSLVDRATDDKTPDDVKEALYKAAAASAKFYGNRLDAPRVDALRKATVAEKTPGVKIAAGEAFGALNLPAEQVKDLITGNNPQGVTQ